MKSRTVIEYEARAAFLDEVAQSRDRCSDESADGLANLAYSLEQLGVAPEGFSRVLALAEQVTDFSCPAALDDVSAVYRIGAVPDQTIGGTSGVRIGKYRGRCIVAWAT